MYIFYKFNFFVRSVEAHGAKLPSLQISISWSSNLEIHLKRWGNGVTPIVIVTHFVLLYVKPFLVQKKSYKVPYTKSNTATGLRQTQFQSTILAILDGF